MPTLNQYVSSSDKSGYYIRANVGASYPITLQVTGLGIRILQEADFSDGSTVPTKLVWSLFDIGLLYTQTTHNIPENQNDIHSAFENADISSKLTAETTDRLIGFLDTYEGESQEKIQQLKTDLETYQPTESDTGESVTSNQGGRFGTAVPSNIDELVSVLFTWSDVGSSGEFQRLRKRIERQPSSILTSFRSFFHHPLLKPKANITNYCSIKYTLEMADWGTFIVEDCRHQIHTSNDGDDIQLRVFFPDLSDVASPIPVIDGQIQSDDVPEVDKQDFALEVLGYLEPVDSVSAESIKEELDTLRDFADLDEDESFIVGQKNAGLRDGNEIPYDLIVDLENAEEMDIQPMGPVPPSDEKGWICVGKVDRISNNGNPVAKLPGGSQTLLPDTEVDEYYFIHETVQGHKSRAFGKIVITD